MNSEQFLNLLEIDGKLVTKRCTESYIQSHGMVDILDKLIDSSFGSISDRIKFLKYGGGYCKVCNCRTNISASGRGFADYCKQHFHEPKKNKTAHNYIDIDIKQVSDMYLAKMSISDISLKLGTLSSVSLKKKMVEAGIEIRSHSDNQKLYARRGFIKPHIIIDRSNLINEYKEQKIPVAALAEKYQCHVETIRRFLRQEGIERFHRRSYIEWKVINLLNNHGINYVTGNKTILGNQYELDIWIPDYNVAIEINGLYTHSVYAGKKDVGYHNMKLSRAQAAGIKLLQFWEDDICNKIDVVESIILNNCVMSSIKLDARKLTVSNISFKDLSNFCKDNHLQGIPGNNTKGIGLFNGNELVSVIGYVENKKCTVIIRFCSLLNHNIRGGFGRLCKQVPGTVLKTYSSNDISNGNLYYKTGFVMESERKSDMWYTDYKILINRQKFMKSKLNKLFANFDPIKTEIENMIYNGYDVVYKSGTKTWVLKKS